MVLAVLDLFYPEVFRMLVYQSAVACGLQP